MWLKKNKTVCQSIVLSNWPRDLLDELDYVYAHFKETSEIEQSEFLEGNLLKKINCNASTKKKLLYYRKKILMDAICRMKQIKSLIASQC